METIIIQQVDPSVLDVVTLTLQQENYHVIPVLQPENDFLQLIRTSSPCAIILDFILNGDDAKAQIKYIKSLNHDIPVIAMSCNPDIDQTAPKFGFDRFIRKPFSLDELIEGVRSAIALAKGRLVALNVNKKVIA
ncbi:MAG: response regulator [Pedobacter sp.]|nr:response regulator [Pedobacter sp.]MDQ8051421.1 response regulator [Pedobacter sp.]